MGIEGLVTFVQVTNNPLAHITPAQTVCNYAGLFARNVASSLSPTGGDGTIGWLRFGLVGGLPNPAPAGGGATRRPARRRRPAAMQIPTGNPPAPTYDYLHANPDPWTASPGPAEHLRRR